MTAGALGHRRFIALWRQECKILHIFYKNRLYKSPF